MNAYTDRVRDVSRQVLLRAAQLTPTQRVSLLVGTVLVAAVTIGWIQVERQATEVLMPGQALSGDKRSEMLKAFADAELSGFSVVEDKIHIPRGQSQRFMAALPDDFRLNERLSHYREEAVQRRSPFERSGDSARRQQLAVVRDMENLICKFEGVEDVFIHVDETVENGLKPKRITTAAVAIVTDGERRLSRHTIDSVRRIVVSSWAGMKLSDVMVIDVLGGWSVGGPGSEDSHVRMLEYALQIQEEIEQHWLAKIREVLTFVPESRVVVTTPTPKIDPDQPASLAMQTDHQISISVSVPMSYHVRRQKNDGRAGRRTLQQVQGDTEREIRQAIHGLIKDDNAQVAVTTFDDLSVAGVASTHGWIAKARGRKWAAAVALLVAAAGVLIVHVTSRSKPQVRRDEPAATISLGNETVDSSDRDSTLDQEDSELRATLTDRIQSDPDRAVRVLNQWLSRAG